MGEPILSYTTRIPDSSSSELVPYIMKLVSTGKSRQVLLLGWYLYLFLLFHTSPPPPFFPLHKAKGLYFDT
jgi:hypothetical protein